MKNPVLKRIIGVIAAGILVGALAVLATGCSTSNESNSGQSESSSSSSSSTPSSSSAAVEKSTPGSTNGNALGGKTLVAYFSGSGNTERVAQDIAADLGADTFTIEPAQPYTEADLNWRDDGSRVNAEHNDESLRAIPLVQVTPDDWASYDTVFIGYPIWWAIAAWPVDGFVSGNDFTGKTVIPFCTSTSSGLGSSAELLEQLAGTGTWLEGQRFASSATNQDVQAWLSTLKSN